MPETNAPKFIVLADDDADDRLLFEEALKEIDARAHITTATDGEDLMSVLDRRSDPNPYIIFLDLNMPKKNGLECLKEIKQTEKFRDVPVVVYSTSCQEDSIDTMYEYGASYYICKPNNFSKLKHSIQQVFTLGLNRFFRQPAKEDFVIAL